MTAADTSRDSAIARMASSLPNCMVEGDEYGNIHVDTTPDRLVDACVATHRQMDAPLATMVGMDDRERTGTFRLSYVFSIPDAWVTVETAIDPARPQFPSVTRVLPAAHWYEREVQDMLGLTAKGHPDPRRLVLHDDWPAGVFPLRKDFDSSIKVPRVSGQKHRFHRLHGEGIVEIPVGPIHAGVIEPGHFRFAAVGENVLHLETRLFYSHRGIEKLAEGKSADAVLQIAERICGACAFSHAVAFCQAVENIAGAVIPSRAAALRSLFLELERLYNHIGDLGNICAGVGFAVGASHGGRLKEHLQQLNERLCTHRFLRGICKVGGVRRDLGAEAIRDAAETLRRVEGQFREFVDLMLSTESFLDRMIGTGIVSTALARDFGAVGIAARASGIDRDARREHRHAGYGDLPITVPTRIEGDVRARTLVRVDESFASFKLAQRLLAALPADGLSIPVGILPPYRTGIGVTESPRGEAVHWVRTGATGLVDRYRIRSASFCNWPIVAHAVPGNMVPDFPLINKSFELCYSCLDR